VLVLTFVFAMLFIRLPMAAADRAADYAMFDPLIDIQHLLNRHFFKDLDEKSLKEMQNGAIRGMLEVLDDRYTEFIPNEEIGAFDKEIRGEYAGIGAQVDTKDGFLLIVSPMEDSPAYRGGIEADDQVIAVDGKSTYKEQVDSVIGRLTGEAGTKVRLTIQRIGNEATDKPAGAMPPGEFTSSETVPDTAPGSFRFDLELPRERIVASTVKGIHRVGDRWTYLIDPERKIGYIRVTQFTAGTIPELEEACKELVDQGLKGLILDLRFNGGGSLRAAIEMADLFLKEGTIVSTKGRTGSEEKAIARAEGTLPDFPMVIVLNGSSASASEVVSGALTDNNRAIALGERSFGKGIVQTLYRLPSGAGQLKVTEQYYYLPSGRCIQRTDDSAEWGVDPTPGFYVPMADDQIREMLRVRRQEEVIRKDAPAPESEKNWSDPQWILDYLKDSQLSAATEAIRKRLETGEWVPTGKETPKGTLELAELEQEQRRYDFIARQLARSERRITALSESTGKKAEEAPDLIPADKDLTGGKVEIKDKDGNVVTILNITGADLEAWLDGAPLKKDEAVLAPVMPEE
jgi:carboxyl-terminal processing protease